MSEREQKVELIQQRLIKKIGEASKGEGVLINAEDAVHIAFMLDIIRVMVRKMEEIIK